MTQGEAEVTRREFIRMTGAAALTAALPASGGEAAWGGWQKGHFQVHLINGHGEQMLWIMPDGTSMLLDCVGGIVPRYVKKANPFGNAVDYMMASHYHPDHVGTPHKNNHSQKGRDCKYDYYRSGFGLAAEKLTFKKAIDRSWPTWEDPLPIEGWCQDYRMHMEKVYKFIVERDGATIEKFRLGATDQIVPLRDPAACAGFSVRNVCANGRIAAKDGTVIDLFKDYIAHKHPKCLNENAMSIGMVVTYGAFRFYSAGDFSASVPRADGPAVAIENEIAKAVGHCQVAKLNHHACKGNPAEFIRTVSAKVWLNVSLSPVHHLTPDVCERLADRKLYPGERMICPLFFPEKRRTEEADRPYMKDIAPASFGNGGHIVLDVPPGGRTFTVTYLSPDDKMTVRSVSTFES